MSFTVSDFEAWARVLREHPEWREEARRLILTDELLAMPPQVREIRDRVELIYEAQQRTEGRVDRLEIALAELAEAQRQTDQRMAELAEVQRRSEERLAALEEQGSRLERALAELAEAQRRSEERLTRLEEQGNRLERALAELAEAQQRTEERLTRVEERVTSLERVTAKLAEAQQRTEQVLWELKRGQDKLWEAVGELRNAFGASVEEEAASVIEVILQRKGYRVLQEAFSLPLNGELDVVLPVEDAQGNKVWALVEAKARLSRGDVRRWSQRVRDVRWQQRLRKKGIFGPFLVYAYSIRRDLGAREQAEKEGIGLLKCDGEILAPRELIEPVV
jgi:uncharacterized protein YeeX (DUF496 family)